MALSLGLLWVISPLVLLGGGLGQVFGLLFVVLLGLQVSAHLAHWREKVIKTSLLKLTPVNTYGTLEKYCKVGSCTRLKQTNIVVSLHLFVHGTGQGIISSGKINSNR